MSEKFELGGIEHILSLRGRKQITIEEYAKLILNPKNWTAC
jgi:hypothetical protein